VRDLAPLADLVRLLEREQLDVLVCASWRLL
jgi:hypothetical protein